MGTEAWWEWQGIGQLSSTDNGTRPREHLILSNTAITGIESLQLQYLKREIIDVVLPEKTWPGPGQIQWAAARLPGSRPEGVEDGGRRPGHKATHPAPRDSSTLAIGLEASDQCMGDDNK